MDVKINKISETKRELDVKISKEEMEKYVSKAAKDFSGTMNIKGFRPGNAPKDVVENVIGKEKLWEEATKEAIKDSYPNIVEENNLFAVSQPKVEIISSAPGEDLSYKAELYIMPEVILPDYKKISEETVRKEKKDVKAEDKEVEDVLLKIRESRAKTKRVQREAKKGDSVTLNFKGSFEGNEEKKIEENDFQVILGKGDLDLFKGFEDNIIGMKESQKKEFSIDLPEPGKKKNKVNFEVEMISVMEREIPEENDELASSLPNIKNLDELKEKIKEGIEADKRSKEEERMKMSVMEVIKKKTSFEVPEILVQKEVDNMLHNLKHQVSSSGISFDEYLLNIKKTEEDIKKEWKKKAEENVSYAIILYKIGVKEEIEVTDKEVEEEMDKHFRLSGKDKSSEKEENLEKMRAYIYDTIKNQKVFKALSIDK